MTENNAWCEFCGNTGYADIAQVAAQDKEGNKIHHNYEVGYCPWCKLGMIQSDADREELKRKPNCSFLPKMLPEGKEWVLRKDNKSEWREHYRQSEIDALIKNQAGINKI